MIEVFLSPSFGLGAHISLMVRMTGYTFLSLFLRMKSLARLNSLVDSGMATQTFLIGNSLEDDMAALTFG